MHQECIKNRIKDETIIIYDNSGNQSQIITNIVFISSDGKKEYRIQKTKKGNYLMQK